MTWSWCNLGITHGRGFSWGILWFFPGDEKWCFNGDTPDLMVI
jgi:hypothetical protein